jgi:hypothetical protein
LSCGGRCARVLVLSALALVVVPGVPLRAAAAAAPPLPLARARLAAYDATYAITGAASGTQTWQIRGGKGGTADVRIRTRIATETVTAALVLGRPGLRLRSARESISAPGVHVSITAVVRGGQIAESAVVNGRKEHVHYPMTATTYANQALLPTLSALPLRPGERSVIRDVVLAHAGDVPVGLAVGKISTVRTPAGTFRCAAVTLSSASGRQTAWVRVGAHPVLVRYANGTTTFTLTALKR